MEYSINGTKGYIGLFDPIRTSEGEISAKEFKTCLNNFQAAGVTELEVEIHSEGGSMFEGFAMHDALKEFPGETTTKSINAFSIASVISQGAKRRLISENGHHMIHFGRGVAEGTGEEIRQRADLVDKMTDRMVGIYRASTGLDESDLREMMDHETWIDADQAVALGLADEITSPVRMVAKIDWSKYETRPDRDEAFVAAVNDVDVTTEKDGDPVSKDVAAKTPTMKELKARFPKAGSDWLVAMMEEEKTMPDAESEYMDDLESRYAKAMEENEELKARISAMEEEFSDPEAMQDNDADPEAMEEEEKETVTAKAKAVRGVTAGVVNSGELFRQKISEIARDKGIPRHQAVVEAGKRFPKLRAQMVKEAN